MEAVRFGAFELDVGAGELRRQGRRVAVTAQAARCLALLTSRPGEIVTRDELRRHLWPDGTFVDFDRSLNFAIASLRAALGDSARSPRFIETLPRRGYRFLADVARVDATLVPPAAAPTHEPVPATSPGSSRPWVWVAIAVILAVQAPLAPPIHSRDTAVPAARAAFARGLAAATGGRDGLRRSAHEFREAARLDARFAEAQYALADTYVRLAERRELPARTALGEAVIAASRAIALDDMPETRVVLGTARLAGDWDWRGAASDFAAALRLAPDYDLANAAEARYLSAAGNDARAIAAIDRAEAISPSCELVLWDSGLISYRARRYDQAVRKLRDAERLGPPGGVARHDWRQQIELQVLFAYAAAGRWGEAHRVALDLMRANGALVETRTAIAREDSRAAVEAFAASSARTMHAAVEAGVARATLVAALHALGGDDALAMEWLARAARDRDPDLVYALRDPLYDRLRATPPFRAVVARVTASR